MARYTEQFLGLSQTPVELKLSVDPSTKRWAKNVLAGIDGSGPVVALNIGASRPQKRWPLSYFVECARMLIANGARILLLGGKPESAEADQIALQVDSASLLNQTGRTTLAEMIGLIAVSDALVTGDTAALHIGTALNTPLVALFGSTDPDQTGPLPGENRVVLYDRLQCSPCRSRPTCAGRFDCMKSLSPQRAAQAVESLLIQQAPVGVGQSKK
jgi:lipopolysaccharide heptosyltransferase II